RRVQIRIRYESAEPGHRRADVRVRLHQIRLAPGRGSLYAPVLDRRQREGPRHDGGDARRDGQEPGDGKAGHRGEVCPRRAGRHGHRGPLRRLGQVAVPHRTAGEERRRRRHHRRLAGPVRHRGRVAAARRCRQQRPRAAGDHGHLERAERESARGAGGQPLGVAVRRMHRFALGTAGALVVALLAGPLARAQSGACASGSQTPAPPSAIKDALGRDTPRGTLLGFMRVARDGNDEAAATYLNTSLRGQAAVDLARQLYVVLDTRLPARIAEVSDRPEGALANPLKPDLDLVGTVEPAGGPLDVFVERVNRGSSGRLWLFSRRTLESIPDVYQEINLVAPDRYFPRPLTKVRIAGVRLFDWIVLFAVVPLCYR